MAGMKSSFEKWPVLSTLPGVLPQNPAKSAPKGPDLVPSGAEKALPLRLSVDRAVSLLGHHLLASKSRLPDTLRGPLREALRPKIVAGTLLKTLEDAFPTQKEAVRASFASGAVLSALM